jgi:D-alanyl-D-alanine carboxypeptidase
MLQCYAAGMRGVVVFSLLVFSVFGHAQELAPDVQAKVEQVAQDTLNDTGVPSASVAVVEGGRLVYARAFGLAHVAPPKDAAAAMAYPIGSISKQFTAAAVLLLQQEGKLSIDEPVSTWFPELTESNKVTLRNLMTMTSGYEDFAPQDYIIPAWMQPIDPDKLVHAWATKPLDFQPGTAWQYSNTNYVLVALIVQKVLGEPFDQFRREHVLSPLHLEGVFNTYTQREKLQVTGYVSNAMAPVRVQPLEATGWYFGDGDLAMPASTLASWDLSIINGTLLSPASYKAFETAFVLKDGENARYGLGTFVRVFDGHRLLEHSGEVGGYVSENMVFPDDKAAVVVLTNEVASSAAEKIGVAIAKLILPEAAGKAEATEAFAPKLKAIMSGLQHGQIDRSLFTEDCNAYFNADTLADFQSTLAPLGAVTEVKRASTQQRGGMTFGLYEVAFAGGTTVQVSTYMKPDGKIEQLLVVGKS